MTRAALIKSTLIAWGIMFGGLVMSDRTQAAEPLTIQWSNLKCVDGKSIEHAQAKWKVVCFLGAECPLARLYGPRLQELQVEYAERGVMFLGVNSNLQDSPADIKNYAAEYKVQFPIVKDAQQTLAKQMAAKRTPEVFVLDAANRVRYRGRVDDQYEPGLSRQKPNRRDLRLALDALLAGKSPSSSKTEAVGCLITFARDVKPVVASQRVTFNRDIAPILNQHCVECHRAGEIGPFALTDFHEVVGWARMMLEVVDQNRMPPWHADPRYGRFQGARRLPEQDRKKLAAWVEQGMPQGDAKDLPPKAKWSAGWHLPTPPDQVLTMRERPYLVSAQGTVDYQYFVVDPKWEEDRWVRAAQVIPGDASVVHHAIVFVRPPDGTRFQGIGWMGGYVPGQRTPVFPPGHARKIPARSKLVFQMHYTPNGRETKDATKVGVWFSKPTDVTHVVSTRVALNNEFEIPPGAKDYAVDLKLEGFALESRLLGVMPHMHLRGKSFQLQLRRDRQDETLLLVPHYDFNWQHWYQLETPLPLSHVDSMRMQVRFDNSQQNAKNPNPKEYVSWGDQTWQEMAVAFVDIAHPRDRARSYRPPPAPTVEQIAHAKKRVTEETNKFFARLDRDGDGFIVREEVPEAFRRYGFYSMDHNNDGRLDRQEVESEARARYGPSR